MKDSKDKFGRLTELRVDELRKSSVVEMIRINETNITW
jgi:hypothetical protein